MAGLEIALLVADDGQVLVVLCHAQPGLQGGVEVEALLEPSPRLIQPAQGQAGPAQEVGRHRRALRNHSAR